MIEIVTHCYAVKYPVYARMLTAQISSLILWQPHVDVLLTVCCNESDSLTLQAIDGFGCRPTPMLTINAMLMPLGELFRRAIGRNRAMKASTADVVWLADADYICGRGCIDAIAAADFGEYRGIIPSKCWIHRSHYEGDAELERVSIGEPFEPDLSLYEAWRPRFAIGGLFIVRGDHARLGYLPDTKWCEPIPDDKLHTGFADTWCDRKYRRRGLEHLVKRVDIPGVFRMRHSVSPFGLK